jgi:GNAT superfamily N-acetyltransferase
METQIKFGFETQWTDLFFELYNKTELKRNDRDQIQQAFANSQVVVSAWLDGKPVAIGRAISDFKMYSSIFDVVVDPAFQKFGLGKKIMQSLLERLDGTAVYLTSTFGNEAFYKKLGFRFHKSALALYPERMKNTPYLFKEYKIPDSLSSHKSFTFSKGQHSDIDGCYPLSEQLGYKTDYLGFSKRFQSLMSSPEHEIIVAKSDTGIVAWMHLGIRRLLEDEDFAQLAAVVVSEQMRGSGIGKHLVKIAEDWSRTLGFATLRLHSSFLREKAHQFYLDNGYTHSKSSKLFVKDLF